MAPARVSSARLLGAAALQGGRLRPASNTFSLRTAASPGSPRVSTTTPSCLGKEKHLKPGRPPCSPGRKSCRAPVRRHRAGECRLQPRCYCPYSPQQRAGLSPRGPAPGWCRAARPRPRPRPPSRGGGQAGRAGPVEGGSPGPLLAAASGLPPGPGAGEALRPEPPSSRACVTDGSPSARRGPSPPRPLPGPSLLAALVPADVLAQARVTGLT